MFYENNKFSNAATRSRPRRCFFWHMSINRQHNALCGSRTSAYNRRMRSVRPTESLSFHTSKSNRMAGGYNRLCIRLSTGQALPVWRRTILGLTASMLKVVCYVAHASTKRILSGSITPDGIGKADAAFLKCWRHEITDRSFLLIRLHFFPIRYNYV